MDDKLARLTPEETAEVNSAFRISEYTEITKDDIELLRNMFKTPESFAILRKVLGILSLSETGLSVPFFNPNLSHTEYEVSRSSDEKIRGAMIRLYQLVRNSVKTDMIGELIEKKDEAKRLEDIEYKKKQDEKILTSGLGENL